MKVSVKISQNNKIKYQYNIKINKIKYDKINKNILLINNKIYIIK